MEWDKHTYFRYNIQIYIHTYIYIHPYYRIWYIYIHTCIHTWCTICIIYVCYIYIYIWHIIYIIYKYIYILWNKLCVIYSTCVGLQSSTDFLARQAVGAATQQRVVDRPWSQGISRGPFFFQEKTLKETHLLRVGAENRFIWGSPGWWGIGWVHAFLWGCFFLQMQL